MAITAVATTKGGDNAAQTSVTVTTSASTQPGDLLIVPVTVRTSTTTPRVTAPDSTWTALTDKPMGTLGHTVIFTKTATTAGATSYGFLLSGGAPHVWFCHVTRGQGGDPTVVGSVPGTTATALTTAAFTPAEASAYVLRILGGTVASGSTTMTGAGLVWGSPAAKLGDQQSGLVWGSVASETGPSPAASIAGRSITLPATPTASVTVALVVPAAPTSAPAATVAPAITTDGTPANGETITCSTGTWTNAPTGYTYQWRRNGTAITGATNASYLLTTSDAGTTITCTVTASNVVGPTAATSDGVAVIAAPSWRAITWYRYSNGVWS